MSGCNRLSDRMPEMALGLGQWSEDEHAHLSSCPHCMAEWALIRAANRMGSPLPPLDHSALAARLLERMGEPGSGPPRRRRLVWGAGLAAAAAALVVWAGVSRLQPSGPDLEAVGETPAETLSLAEADSLLSSDEEPLAGWSMLESPTLGDLDADELERVLRSWEG